MLTDELIAALTPLPKGSLVVLTVGNSLRSDDGAGSYMGKKLVSAGNIKIVNAEDRPENMISEITALKPSKVVIIDAADFGGKPGEKRIIPIGEIPSAALSTHSLPLSLVAAMIKEETGADIVFLGIQGESFAFGEKLSRDVKTAADEITDFVSAECKTSSYLNRNKKETGRRAGII